jgi:transglutaminase-like putative cysteine protease
VVSSRAERKATGGGSDGLETGAANGPPGVRPSSTAIGNPTGRTPMPSTRCSTPTGGDPPAVRGESHAWIEAWTGGWWGYDPTNDIEIGHRHVWVAVGRDFADVPPLKGIFSGEEARSR